MVNTLYIIDYQHIYSETSLHYRKKIKQKNCNLLFHSKKLFKPHFLIF
jgi:hypothetical protein